MIALRPATPQDRFRLRRWLADPALPCWWGPQSCVEAEITLAFASESALARIIERGGEAVGYAQAADAMLWGGGLPPDFAAGQWDVDAFVAAPDVRDEAISRAISLLCAEVFATTMALGCCSFVSIRNEASARAFERAGFRWHRIWHDRYLGPSWVMELQRPC